MSVKVNDVYKDELVNHLSSAVKQIQMEYLSAEVDGKMKPCITNDSPAGRVLFSCLEMILSHGLKRQHLGVWHAVEYFCRNDVKRTINNLVHVKSSKGKSRAWIYLTLNERELEGYFQSFQTNLPHFYKFYARSALVCSNQVSLLQTLISGLDWVVFNLELDISGSEGDACYFLTRPTDTVVEHYMAPIPTVIRSALDFQYSLAHATAEQDVSYLDLSIMCGKNWTKDCSSNQTIDWKISHDKGSVIHINTKSISEVSQKAVGLIKGIMSQENSSSSKSMEDIDSNMLLAVNSNQHHTLRKKYCPDCGSPNELICLCDTKKKQQPVETARSENAEILQNFLPCNETDRERASIFQGKRINPFDSAHINEEIEMTTRFKRFDVHVAVTDTPIKVERKPRKRRKKFSDTPSACSTKSEDAITITGKDGEFRDFMQKRGSHGNICLSNPLIGFDPGSEENSPATSEFSLLNIDDGQDENIVFVETEVATNTVNSGGTCSKNIELIRDEINTLNTDCVLSCQNRSIDNFNVEIHTVTEKFVDVVSVGSSPNMESSKTHGEVLDANKDMLCGEIVEQPIVDTPLDEMGDFKAQETSDPLGVTTVHSEDMKNEGIEDLIKEKQSPHHSRTSSVDSKAESQLSTPVGSCLPMSSQSTPIKRTANDFATSSDCDERMEELNKEGNENRSVEMDVRLMSPAEKKDFRKMKSATRYRSQSERLLEDLTKREVERLRAEIEARLKPSRDKLEKVQKYILERTTSSETDDTVTSKEELPSTSNVDSINQTSDDAQPVMKIEPSTSDTTNALTSPRDTTDSMQSSTIPNFKAVANIDNSLRLYLMLEILVNENEEIVKTIEFVFYKTKKSAKPRKQPPSRYRVKVMVDSCDADLTNLLISSLSEAVSTHTRRWGSVKVCPPVFRDAREHEISLVKYLRSEGLTGNIQYYQLVHWEDPDFVKGASVAKVFMRGTLKYKVHSFWGSSTKSAYFLLKGGILYQYANRDMEKPDRSYELTGGKCVGCRRIKSSESGNSAGLDFVIDFQGDSKLELSGFSIMEVTEWLQCLCMIVSLDQSSRIDQQACTDGIVMNMLNHDALVPCGLIIADETLLLCHEDHHTGFCRTLATAKREDIQAINIDRTESIVCELVVEKNINMPQTTKWGIFFPRQELLEAFLNVVDSFSKAPSLCEKGGNTNLTHYLEARALLDSRWTRTDNLLKGRSAGSENYTFI